MTVRPGPLDTTAILKDILDRLRALEMAKDATAVVLRSPNGSRWRVTVTDGGALVVTAL